MTPIDTTFIEKAKQNGTWLRSTIEPDLVLAPDELEEHQTYGEYRWGASNWVEVKPEEVLKDLEQKRDRSQLAIDMFMERWGDRV